MKWARVDVEGAPVSKTGAGLLILLGVAAGDGIRDAESLARKAWSLRIFEDGEGRMNLSLKDIGGEAMVVSQFTLVADTRKGNRPGFSTAAPPDLAERLYGRDRWCTRIDWRQRQPR